MIGGRIKQKGDCFETSYAKMMGEELNLAMLNQGSIIDR